MTSGDLKNARWTLVVEFDPLETALEDGDYEWPVGEAATFVQRLTDMWGLDWSELNEVEWVGDVVKVRVDVVDYLVDPIHWLMMSTIPRRIELVRNEDRT